MDQEQQVRDRIVREARIHACRLRFIDVLLNKAPHDHGDVVSDDAWTDIKHMVAELEAADPAEFRPGPDGNRYTRRIVRYLCALIPDSVPDHKLHLRIHEIVGNTNVSAEEMREIVAGNGTKETPGPTLRRVAAALREQPQSAVVRQFVGQVGKGTIERLSVWLGEAEASEQRLMSKAIDLAEAGGSVADLMEATGIGRTRALRLMRAARETLAAMSPAAVELELEAASA